MSNPRVAHCVFCDDIRQEVGNKISMMGMYLGELIIQGTAPIALPKFGFVIWIISDVDDPIQHVTTRVLMPPDQKEVIHIEMTQAVQTVFMAEGAQKLVAHQIIPVAPFIIEQPGMIEVMLETDRGSMRAGRLLVRFVEPPQTPSPPGTDRPQANSFSPTASPPPSEQSPPDVPVPERRPSRRRPSSRRTSRTPVPE
jgi:hypothetical protein